MFNPILIPVAVFASPMFNFVCHSSSLLSLRPLLFPHPLLKVHLHPVYCRLRFPLFFLPRPYECDSTSVYRNTKAMTNPSRIHDRIAETRSFKSSIVIFLSKFFPRFLCPFPHYPSLLETSKSRRPYQNLLRCVLIHSGAWPHSSHFTRRSSRRHWRSFHLARGDYIVNFKYH